MPKHIWKNVTQDEFAFSQWNTLPVGSGPYKVSKVERNSGGIPDYYELAPFDSVQGKPYIQSIIFKFYPSETDLIKGYENGEVESISGLSPQNLDGLKDKGVNIVETPLPRVFALFFNQSRSSALRDSAVRRALDLSAPRERVVEEVFNGFASPISGPLPAGLYSWTTWQSDESLDERVTRAKDLLDKALWKRGADGTLEKKSGSETIRLSFTISTGDAPELLKTAELLASVWKSLGAEVKILTFESGELNQSVIRPRQFEALLFGELVGRDADLYPFWHSSQRTDPGLNIALYANTKADRLIEEARVAGSLSEVEQSIKELTDGINADVPAIFLYTPNLLYLVPEKVKSVEVGALGSSYERFSTIRDWYIETDRVWKIFLD